jgi:hypothetical protein
MGGGMGGGMPGGMGGGMGGGMPGGMPGGMGGLFGSLFDEGPMGHGAAGYSSEDDMAGPGMGKRPRQPAKNEIDLRVKLEELCRWGEVGGGSTGRLQADQPAVPERGGESFQLEPLYR